MNNSRDIRTELDAGHPVTGEYNANNLLAADQLNAMNIVQNVKTVSGQDLFEAVVPSEYNALTSDQKQLFQMLVGMGTILVNAPNTRGSLLSVFGNGTATRDNLANLQTETVSQATAKGWGYLYEGHIQAARAL